MLGDPTKAKQKLNWSPKFSLAEPMKGMALGDYDSARRDSLVTRRVRGGPLPLEAGPQLRQFSVGYDTCKAEHLPPRHIDHFMKRLKLRSHTLTILSLAGSGLGFISQLLLARSFGVSVSVDAYFFSLGVPVFIGGLVSSAIAYSLTPKLRQQLMSSSEGTFSSRSISRLSLLAMGALWFVGLALAPLQWLSLPNNSAIKLEPGIAWLIFGSWVLAGLLVQQSAMASLLTAQDRLMSAAVLPLFSPAFSCIAVLLGAGAFGVSSMLAGQIAGVIISVVFASNLQPKVHGATHQLKSWRSMLRGFGYATVAMACFTTYPLLDSLLATRTGSHGVSQIAFAQRIVIGLGTLTVAAPFAILANRFADLATRDTRETFVKGVARAVCLGMLAPAALACLFIFYGDVLVHALFGRGKFTAADATEVGSLIGLLAPGMVMMLLTALLFRAGFALPGGGRYLAGIGVLWTVGYACFGWLLLPLGVSGLAMAYSGTWFLTGIAAVGGVNQAAKAHFRLA